MDPLAQSIENIVKSLGIPKRIFVGVDRSSGESYSAVLVKRQNARFKKWQKEAQVRIEKEYIAPLVLDMLNPLEFAFLLPLGKKAYCRRFHQGWKLPKIEWLNDEIHMV